MDVVVRLLAFIVQSKRHISVKINLSCFELGCLEKFICEMFQNKPE